MNAESARAYLDAAVISIDALRARPDEELVLAFSDARALADTAAEAVEWLAQITTGSPS